MMMKDYKNAAALLCIPLLCGCIPSDYTKEEREDREAKAVEIAEDYLYDHYRSAQIKESTFFPIDTAKSGVMESHMSDWVQGKYSNGGEKSIAVNVETGEIYTSQDWVSFCMYGKELVYDLYGLSEANAVVEIYGRIDLPACVDDDTYEDIRIYDMLPADVTVDEDFVKDVFASEEYGITIRMIVNDEVDMSIFENTEPDRLGNNISVRADQYRKELVDRYYTPGSGGIPDGEKPIASYDSEGSSMNNSANNSVNNSASQTQTDDDHDMTPVAIRYIVADEETVLSLDAEENPVAKEFYDKIDQDIVLRNEEGNALTGDLPLTLPATDKETTAETGDIFICDGNRIVFCMEPGTVCGTKIGRIDGDTEEEINEAFGGKEEVTVRFGVDWTE